MADSRLAERIDKGYKVYQSEYKKLDGVACSPKHAAEALVSVNQVIIATNDAIDAVEKLEDKSSAHSLIYGELYDARASASLSLLSLPAETPLNLSEFISKQKSIEKDYKVAIQYYQKAKAYFTRIDPEEAKRIRTYVDTAQNALLDLDRTIIDSIVENGKRRTPVGNPLPLLQELGLSLSVKEEKEEEAAVSVRASSFAQNCAIALTKLMRADDPGFAAFLAKVDPFQPLADGKYKGWSLITFACHFNNPTVLSAIITHGSDKPDFRKRFETELFRPIEGALGNDCVPGSNAATVIARSGAVEVFSDVIVPYLNPDVLKRFVNAQTISMSTADLADDQVSGDPPLSFSVQGKPALGDLAHYGCDPATHHHFLPGKHALLTQRLISSGADIMLANSEGETPIDWVNKVISSGEGNIQARASYALLSVLHRVALEKKSDDEAKLTPKAKSAEAPKSSHRSGERKRTLVAHSMMPPAGKESHPVVAPQLDASTASTPSSSRIVVKILRSNLPPTHRLAASPLSSSAVASPHGVEASVALVSPRTRSSETSRYRVVKAVTPTANVDDKKPTRKRKGDDAAGSDVNPKRMGSLEVDFADFRQYLLGKVSAEEASSIISRCKTHRFVEFDVTKQAGRESRLANYDELSSDQKAFHLWTDYRRAQLLCFADEQAQKMAEAKLASRSSGFSKFITETCKFSTEKAKEIEREYKKHHLNEVVLVSDATKKEFEILPQQVEDINNGVGTMNTFVLATRLARDYVRHCTKLAFTPPVATTTTSPRSVRAATRLR